MYQAETLKSLSVVFFFILLSCDTNHIKPTILIENVIIVDGQGNKPSKGSIRIKDDKIVAVGQIVASKSDSIINGRGWHVSPGFIDSHSHHDSGRAPTYEAALSQGITTIIIGQDGFSRFPIGTYLDTIQTHPEPINIASYTGHNTIRLKVMDDYKREANGTEIDSMKLLLKQEMEGGAIGLSTGLEYDPGIYSSTEEVIELSKELQAYGGRYISHMRSEDVGLEAAIEEIIKIGKEADVPVQISHFKLGRKGLWGKAQEFINRLNEARKEGVEITADVYPYEYWSSTMTVLFPKRDFDNIESARFALSELTTPEGMIISSFNADTTYEGKTLAEIADERNQDPAQTYLDLIAMSIETPGESIIAKSMTKEDIYTLLSWEHANLCSDGSPTGHPRGWGSFPRYFSEAKDIPIEERIIKMTSQAAQNIGIGNIGEIKPGYFADLVLFNPETLKDKATFNESSQPAEGIIQVWVSGKKVYDQGRLTGIKSGRVIRRG
ncbi:MAG: amidohydrolase family protein [Saprospiraceae bacterium]|nr:amidohydrolase family protein [Saprospiraceae bacterium]